MSNNFNKLIPIACLAGALMATGCEYMGPKRTDKLLLQPVMRDTGEPTSAVLYKDLQNKQSAADRKPPSEFYPGSGRYVPAAPGQYQGDRSGRQGSYSLNFDDADLGEVAKVILGDILGQNYILSPKVAGRVTLQTTQALTKEELLPTLERVLRMNNAALIKEGRTYHIEPANEALYSSGISSGGQVGYQTRVFPIRNVAADDIAEIIKPLVNEKTILHTDSSRNIIIASGTADEMARVTDLIATFDIDLLRGRSFGLFPLAHVEPETIIKELDEIFNNSKGSEDEDSSGFCHFMAVERLNAVLSVCHQAHYLQDIESWVYRLDRANTASGGGVNVYKVQHVDAEELADTLNEIFTGAAKKEKAAKVAPGQTAASISNKDTGAAGAAPQNVQKTGASSKKSSRGSSSTGNPQVSNVENVKIIADAANNALVVVSTPQEYAVILPVIRQLDILPLQVLIDATIVEVTLNDNLKYGIKWYLSHENGGENVIAGGDASSSAARASLLPGPAAGTSLRDIAASAITGGFGYSFISNSGDIRAVLNAEATRNNLNVISSPSLMILNNQEGSIQVGDEIPLRTSQSTSVTNVNSAVTNGQTTGGLVTSGIQQRKTGVKLKLKPRVNASGLVIMDLEQSVETPVTTSTSGIDSPTIQTREITSSVAVHSGESIVLGGLIRETNTFNKSGIPILHTLPLIGPLFGGTINNKDRTELVVLITPRVVQSKQDARLISNEFKRKLTGLYKDAPPPAYISKPKDWSPGVRSPGIRMPENQTPNSGLPENR